MSDVESLSDDRIGEGEDSTADRNTKKVWFKDGSDDSLANMVVDLVPKFEDGDIRRSNLNGILAIDFSDRITKILIKGMEFTVVVKLFGLNIGYGALYNHITMDFDPSRPFPCGVLAWIHFLEKSLTSQVLVNGRLQRVEFEALPDVCFSSAKKRDALPTVGEAFGPWMVVEHKFRRKQEGIRGQKTKILEGNLVGSQFEKLFSMDFEYLTSNLEAPSKVLGTTRFIQGDFIKNLKGKEIEKGSGSVVVVNLGKGLSGRVDDCGPGIESRSLGDNSAGQELGLKAHVSPRVGDMAFKNFGPHSTLGLQQKCNGSPLECLALQRVVGQISNSYNLGLEGATGIKNKDLTILISFSNDKATSLHSNLTFEKHPKAKVGLISNALNLKKHIVVTFQKKLDNKSKPKMRAKPSNIPKGHGAKSRKRNGYSGKSLFKSIRGYGGKFKPASSSRVSLPKALGSMEELISVQVGISIDKPDVKSGSV
ncbi:hypothetical protein Gotur_005531 [Gossypium turneri]